MTPASESESPARFERALSFLRGTLAGCVDSFAAVEEGWLALTPSLPRVWFGNQLRLRGPVELDALLCAAERHLGGLPYRQVVVEADGAGLEGQLRERGWQLTRLVVMALTSPPRSAGRADGPPDGHPGRGDAPADGHPGRGDAPADGPPGRADAPAIASIGEAQWAEAYRGWHLEDPRITPEDADQVVAMGLREGRVRGDRRFGVLGGAGGDEVLAIASLRSDRGVAQIEDVWTAPEARGRGYARALVARALLCVGGAPPVGGVAPSVQPAAEHAVGSAAEHAVGSAADRAVGSAVRDSAGGADQLTFIVADDEDWPKQLYARLGFAPVGYLWEFHRDAVAG